MARWVTRRNWRDQQEDLERAERERRIGDVLAAILFAAGLLLIAFWTAHQVDIYFGDYDQWGTVSNRADESSALFSFLSDLLLGISLGLGLVGLSWLTARSLLRTTPDDEYVSVGTGQPEAAQKRATRGVSGTSTAGS